MDRLLLNPKQILRCVHANFDFLNLQNYVWVTCMWGTEEVGVGEAVVSVLSYDYSH